MSGQCLFKEGYCLATASQVMLYMSLCDYLTTVKVASDWRNLILEWATSKTAKPLKASSRQRLGTVAVAAVPNGQW